MFGNGHVVRGNVFQDFFGFCDRDVRIHVGDVKGGKGGGGCDWGLQQLFHKGRGIGYIGCVREGGDTHTTQTQDNTR